MSDSAHLPIDAAPDLLRHRASRYPDHAGLHVDGVGELTFGAWHRDSGIAATHLAAAGARRGTRIGLLFGDRDWLTYAVAYMGVLRTGATAVHLGADLPPAELRRRLRQAGVTLLVHGASVTPPRGPRVLAHERLCRPAEPLAPVALYAGDIADVLWTSGTTGAAKAFTNPHGTLTYGRGPAGLAELDVSAAMLAPMPMGTPSSAMSVGMMPLSAPATVVLCHPGDAGRIGALIERHRVATLLATPWVAMRLVAERVHERYDLSSLTTVAVASAPLPAATARALTAIVPGLTVTTAYAQGEAVPAVVLNHRFDPDRPSLLGRAAPGTGLRVVDPHGADAAPGEVGEIWLRSDAPKRLYLDPERNAAVHAGGWTRTRDLGWFDDEGLLHLFDRQVDAIGTISSIAVEQVLYDHPGVREAAVIAAAEPQRGCAAVLALAPGTDLADVAAHARAHLPAARVPVSFRVVPALPRGVTGKVLKHRLRNGIRRLPPRDRSGRFCSIPSREEVAGSATMEARQSPRRR